MIMLEVPYGKMLSTLGDRAFMSAAPKLWNSLHRGQTSEAFFVLFSGISFTDLVVTWARMCKIAS